MAKLILSFEGTVQKTVKLDKERITIGRRPENDIQVDNLGVSGEHAVVTTLLNDSVIEDLNSTNGTMVNGQPIQKHLLQQNDVIEIGKHKLKYQVESPAAPTAYTNFEKTMVIRRPAAPLNPGEPTPNTVGLRPAAMPAAPPPPPVHAVPPAAAAVPPPTQAQAPAPVRAAAVQVVSGAAVGRVLDLTKPLTSIGKAGVQVAVLTRRPTGFFLTHVEGTSFPMLNGEPIGKQAYPLKDNDTIEIAGIKLNFFYKS